MIPLDPTLTTSTAASLEAIADALLKTLARQSAGDLGLEEALVIVREKVSDLRAAGRDLLRVQEGVVATINADFEAGLVADYNAAVSS